MSEPLYFPTLANWEYLQWMEMWIYFTLETRHEWVDGTELDYTQWEPGRPIDDPNRESCVEMNMMGNNVGKWRDSPCTGEYGYICKTAKGEIPLVFLSIENPVYPWNICLSFPGGIYHRQKERKFDLELPSFSFSLVLQHPLWPLHPVHHQELAFAPMGTGKLGVITVTSLSLIGPSTTMEPRQSVTGFNLGQSWLPSRILLRIGSFTMDSMIGSIIQTIGMSGLGCIKPQMVRVS